MNINNNTVKLVFYSEQPDAVIRKQTKKKDKIEIEYLNNYKKIIRELDSGRVIEYNLIAEYEANDIRNRALEIEKDTIEAQKDVERFRREMLANQIGK